jgi:hypothetical protein
MMAKKKRKAPPRRKSGSRKKPAGKSKSVRRAVRRPSAKKRARKKTSRKSPAKRTRASAASRARRSSPRPRARIAQSGKRGLGLESGGQSGDTERISRAAIADSESVEELLEEGQAFEAGVVDGVENAPGGELRTREVPEDDVPQEYLDED